MRATDSVPPRQPDHEDSGPEPRVRPPMPRYQSLRLRLNLDHDGDRELWEHLRAHTGRRSGGRSIAGVLRHGLLLCLDALDGNTPRPRRIDPHGGESPRESLAPSAQEQGSPAASEHDPTPQQLGEVDGVSDEISDALMERLSSTVIRDPPTKLPCASSVDS